MRQSVNKFLPICLVVTLLFIQSACTTYEPQADVSGDNWFDGKVDPEVKQNTELGFILKRSGPSGYVVEDCPAPNKWVKDGRDQTKYCFDQDDIRYAFNKNLLPGVKYQYQGPQFGKVIWDSVLLDAGKNLEQNYDGNITMGYRNRGASSAIRRYAKTDEYKRTCMEKFMDSPNAIINGVLPTSPVQLGTYNRCVNQLRIQTTVNSTGSINFNF